MKEANVQTNTIYNTIKSVSAVVFPLISFPYISRVLLTEGVGKINFGNSIISYFSLIASLGITTYAVRECAKVRQDAGKLSQTASQMFSINMLTTFIAYALLALTLVFARPLQDYRQLIVVQSTVILFTTLGADWLNTAMEDFRFITLRTVFFQILSLVLMFLFVKGPEHYMRYAIISVISGSGANIVNMFYRRKYCKVSFTTDMQLRRHLTPILLMFSLMLTQTIYVNSDITILGLFHGDHEVGLYSTAVKIYTIVNTTVASVAFVLMPKLSYWFSEDNYGEINKLLRYGLNFIVVLGFPCIVGLNAITVEIIQIMAGEQYLGAVPSLHILTIAMLMSFLGGFIGNLILLPSGREKICLRTSMISATLNIVLNLIFIPLFGSIAAAVTTATAETAGFLINIHHVEKRVELGSLRKTVLAPLVGCAAMILVLALVAWLVKALVLRVVLSVVLSAGVYLAVLLLMKHEFTLDMIKRNKKV